MDLKYCSVLRNKNEKDRQKIFGSVRLPWGCSAASKEGVTTSAEREIRVIKERVRDLQAHNVIGIEKREEIKEKILAGREKEIGTGYSTLRKQVYQTLDQATKDYIASNVESLSFAEVSKS